MVFQSKKSAEVLAEVSSENASPETQRADLSLDAVEEGTQEITELQEGLRSLRESEESKESKNVVQDFFSAPLYKQIGGILMAGGSMLGTHLLFKHLKLSAFPWGKKAKYFGILGATLAGAFGVFSLIKNALNLDISKAVQERLDASFQDIKAKGEDKLESTSDKISDSIDGKIAEITGLELNEYFANLSAELKISPLYMSFLLPKNFGEFREAYKNGTWKDLWGRGIVDLGLINLQNPYNLNLISYIEAHQSKTDKNLSSMSIQEVLMEIKTIKEAETADSVESTESPELQESWFDFDLEGFDKAKEVVQEGARAKETSSEYFARFAGALVLDGGVLAFDKGATYLIQGDKAWLLSSVNLVTDLLQDSVNFAINKNPESLGALMHNWASNEGLIFAGSGATLALIQTRGGEFTSKRLTQIAVGGAKGAIIAPYRFIEMHVSLLESGSRFIRDKVRSADLKVLTGREFERASRDQIRSYLYLFEHHFEQLDQDSILSNSYSSRHRRLSIQYAQRLYALCKDIGMDLPDEISKEGLGEPNTLKKFLFFLKENESLYMNLKGLEVPARISRVKDIFTKNGFDYLEIEKLKLDIDSLEDLAHGLEDKTLHRRALRLILGNPTYAEWFKKSVNLAQKSATRIGAVAILLEIHGFFEAENKTDHLARSFASVGTYAGIAHATQKGMALGTRAGMTAMGKVPPVFIPIIAGGAGMAGALGINYVWDDFSSAYLDRYFPNRNQVWNKKGVKNTIEFIGDINLLSTIGVFEPVNFLKAGSYALSKLGYGKSVSLETDPLLYLEDTKRFWIMPAYHFFKEGSFKSDFQVNSLEDFVSNSQKALESAQEKLKKAQENKASLEECEEIKAEIALFESYVNGSWVISRRFQIETQKVQLLDGAKEQYLARLAEKYGAEHESLFNGLIEKAIKGEKIESETDLDLWEYLFSTPIRVGGQIVRFQDYLAGIKIYSYESERLDYWMGQIIPDSKEILEESEQGVTDLS